MPKTVLTGESWSATRNLIADHWHVEYVLSSHEADHWNFSDSTDLSEALVVARKWRKEEDRREARTTWVALWRNPLTPVEALAVASAIRRQRHAGASGEALRTGEGFEATTGEIFTRPAPDDGSPWRHATFARSSLDAIAGALFEDKAIPLPDGSASRLPLVQLHEICEVGPDRARIHDGFIHADLPTGFNALWGHDSDLVRSLESSPNQHLREKPGREDYAHRLWKAAARLMIAERLWLHTQRCSAVLLDEIALSNVWWPVRVASDDLDDARIIAVWLNSSLGLLSFVAASEETRGPFIAIKKNKLHGLPIIDPQNLSADARGGILAAWTAFARGQLEPIARLDKDPARGHIDRVICQAFGINEAAIDSLRVMLASEPRWSKPVPRESRRSETERQLLIPL